MGFFWLETFGSGGVRDGSSRADDPAAVARVSLSSPKTFLLTDETSL